MLFISIFRHLKLELLTQFLASNDEKYVYSYEELTHRKYNYLMNIYHKQVD